MLLSFYFLDFRFFVRKFHSNMLYWMRKEARECGLDTFEKADRMKLNLRGLSSVSLSADSFLCGGSLLAARSTKPP